MKNLLVIDGNSILNRQYYGIRPLCTKSGIFTNAVFGFTKVLLSQLEKLSPVYAAVAFDRREKTFRHERYEAYKAGRHAAPEELLMQFPYARRMAEALGFPVLSLAGYEADDILGTLAALAGQEEEAHAYLLTGDRDSLQLIDAHTTVLLAGNRELTAYDPPAFFEKYGVEASQFVDVKALMGDSSDNIPGVPGIGEKTALKLIAAAGSLDALYEDDFTKLPASLLTPSVRKKLEEGKDSAFLSRFLAKIDRCVPLGLSLKDLILRKPDRAALRELFCELEFTAFNRLLEGPDEKESVGGASSPAAPFRPPRLLSPAALASLPLGAPFALCLTDRGIYLAGPDAGSEKTDAGYLLKGSGTLSSGLSEASGAEGAAASGDMSGTGDATGAGGLAERNGSGGADKEAAFSAADEALIRKFLLSRGKDAVVYDGKALLHRFFSEAEGEIPHFAFDVLLAAYVLDASAGSYDLARLSAGYLGESLREDNPAMTLLLLAGALKKRMEEEGSDRLYGEIEQPLSEVLFRMEKRGFFVDLPMLASFSETLDRAAAGYMEEIYRLAGQPFNINSPKQLGEVLFERLSLPVFKKNKSGYSTDAEVLEKLRPYHPIISLITEYRQAVKFKSTYADPLGRAADGEGRVHTSFHQTVTATGRLSSTEPNLQNIPVRTELGRMFRRAFAAKEGALLVDADYSQIELRILAALSGDARMIEAFKNGVDIHTVTASEVFGLLPEEVTPELRKRAKAVNFGIVYGIGGYSLAGDLGVSLKEATRYIQSYKNTYRDVDAFLNRMVEEAKKNGFVTTLFGRRRYIPELTAQRAALKSFGERVAMNSPIQGTAADIIKLAMLRVESALSKEGLASRLILQVHDELIIESPEEEAEAAAAILRREMEGAVSLDVPLTVEVSIGKTWYDCK